MRTLETIVSIVMSILFGMIPEVLFFTLFLVNTKNLKEKKIKLFFGIMLVYIVCIMINRFKTLYYLLFIFGIYVVLKLLYKNKTEIIDIFIINIGLIYIAFLSAICFAFVGKSYIMYYAMMFLDKILLFIPFIFRNKFNEIYKRYCSLWNRNDKVKRPIKSITLRNISLIGLNTFIFICDVVFLYILNL